MEAGAHVTALLLPWPLCEVCDHVGASGEADDGTVLCAECAAFGVEDGIVESFAAWAPDIPRHVVHATDNPWSRVDGRCAICDAQVFDPATPEKGVRSD